MGSTRLILRHRRDQEAEMGQQEARGGSHIGSEAGRDFVAPLLLGIGIWTSIALTSGRPLVWNDARYWPATIAAAFMLGFLVKVRPGRAGLLLAASGPSVGAGVSILHVGEPTLLAIAPLVLFMFGSAGALSARVGAAVRGSIDRLARRHLVHMQFFGEGAAGLRDALLPTGARGHTTGMAAAARR
jgi:hypothetical protein